MKNLPLIRVVYIATALALAASVVPALHALEAKEGNSPKAEVSVTGRIKYPGRYQVTAESTLVDVLKSAGGLTSEASGTVTLARRNRDGSLKRIELDAAKDGAFHLEAGDIIFVRPGNEDS